MAKSDNTWWWIAAGGLMLLAFNRPKPKPSAKALPASTGSIALPAAAANGAKVAR